MDEMMMGRPAVFCAMNVHSLLWPGCSTNNGAFLWKNRENGNAQHRTRGCTRGTYDRLDRADPKTRVIIIGPHDTLIRPCMYRPADYGWPRWYSTGDAWMAMYRRFLLQENKRTWADHDYFSRCGPSGHAITHDNSGLFLFPHTHSLPSPHSLPPAHSASRVVVVVVRRDGGGFINTFIPVRWR
jgi:hypothetical protein